MFLELQILDRNVTIVNSVGRSVLQGQILERQIVLYFTRDTAHTKGYVYTIINDGYTHRWVGN